MRFHILLKLFGIFAGAETQNVILILKCRQTGGKSALAFLSSGAVPSPGVTAGVKTAVLLIPCQSACLHGCKPSD